MTSYQRGSRSTPVTPKITKRLSPQNRLGLHSGSRKIRKVPLKGNLAEEKLKALPGAKSESTQPKPFTCVNEKGRIGDTDDWRPGKRMNITAVDTGRIQNKTIVSVESPDWMKSFFENNRSYFEKQGLAQRLKKADIGESSAGVSSSARAKGKKSGTNMMCDETGVALSQNLGSANTPDWMNSARKWTAASPNTPRRMGERAGKDRFTSEVTPRDKSASEMQHLLVSESVPEWMRSAAVVQVMNQGNRSARPQAEQGDTRAAGVTTERFWDSTTRNKGGNMVHPMTGRVVHKAQQSDDFPLESGASHRAAFEETIRKRPNSARESRGRYAGDRSKESRDKKKGTVLDQDTGKVANNSIVSPESPAWMKGPFENNRDFFENQGVAEKLRTLSTQDMKEKEFVAGRKVPVRQRQVHKQHTNEAGRVQNLSIVSRAAPEWMKSPFESNRTYFEDVGIAQGKELVRSRSAPPSTKVAPSEEQPEVQAEMGVPGQVTELPYDADKATVEPEVKSKGLPCHAEQRSERRRKSASTISSTSRASKRSSSASATYSARYQKSRSIGSMG
ncbi:unnamed protein product [Durusdinium trenchii]|uniref:Uncharacterized protein n=1 Tax=Durusdinium trenchii TaxID=1381693 RepID=A0ABP0SLK7_9DINO